MINKKKVCVFGLGYIGLPTSLLLAKSGFKVFGMDTNKKVINTLRNNKIHISEPSLNQTLENTLEENTFIPVDSAQFADVFLIAVPTPFFKDGGQIPKPNTKYIESAASMISKVLRPGNLVIIESTSPVGTSEKIYNQLLNQTSLKTDQFQLAYCPERVLPGQIMNELIHNNRIVGGINKESSLSASKFYKNFCKGKVSITNCRTAELVKLAENAYRDVNIAFANEMSIICDSQKINPSELIKLANDHPRVNILNPGCGVGGHCIAVDPWFIASQEPKNTALIQTARNVNNRKTKWCFETIKEKYAFTKKKIKREPIIGCLGITYKPNVDDIRESPALKIIQDLLNEGIELKICEPNINSIENIELFSLDYVLKNSDILVILVAHNEFKCIDLNKDNIIDFRY